MTLEELTDVFLKRLMVTRNFVSSEGLRKDTETGSDVQSCTAEIFLSLLPQLSCPLVLVLLMIQFFTCCTIWLERPSRTEPELKPPQSHHQYQEPRHKHMNFQIKSEGDCPIPNTPDQLIVVNSPSDQHLQAPFGLLNIIRVETNMFGDNVCDCFVKAFKELFLLESLTAATHGCRFINDGWHGLKYLSSASGLRLTDWLCCSQMLTVTVILSCKCVTQ